MTQTTDAALVERLRAYRPTDEWGDGVHHVICDEAADTIEAQARRIEALEGKTLNGVIGQARKALRLVEGCMECNADDERRWRETIVWLEGLA